MTIIEKYENLGIIKLKTEKNNNEEDYDDYY